LILVAGCVQTGNVKDCGSDWACFQAQAKECSLAKVLRTDSFEGGSASIALSVEGGNNTACKIKIKPEKLDLSGATGLSDEAKAGAQMLTFTDMTCTLDTTSFDKFDLFQLSDKDMANCEGSLASVIGAFMQAPSGGTIPPQPTTTGQNTGITKLSVYCEQKGGKVKTTTDDKGNQYSVCDLPDGTECNERDGICTLPDGTECDEQNYYNGECNAHPQPTAGIANPASVYCEQKGGKTKITTDPRGNQLGFCILPDGTECDEWAYYKGDCVSPQASNETNLVLLYCEKAGGKIQTITDPMGGQLHNCLMPNGQLCSEWSDKGDCTAEEKAPAASTGDNNAASGDEGAYHKYCVEHWGAPDNAAGICEMPDGRMCDLKEFFTDQLTPSSACKTASGKTAVAPTGAASMGSTEYAYLNFETGKQFTDFSEGAFDVKNEPWCTPNPALCGNFVDTGKSALEDVTSAPSSFPSDTMGGYDKALMSNCAEVPLYHVLAFKLSDGTYAKAIVVVDNYVNDAATSTCGHTIVIKYAYPM
jgi:putative hemolysin